MSYEPPRNANRAKGLSLVELLIAIGIMGVTMLLIGAAFPAGVAMSIAVSDEATSQAVFQKALTVIRDNYSISKITVDFGVAELPGSGNYILIKDAYLGKDGTGNYDAAEGLANRKFATNSTFSWSAMIRRMSTTGPRGNLCQVVIVVSRRPNTSPSFDVEGGGTSTLPELRSVTCTGSSVLTAPPPPPVTAKTLIIDSTDFSLVPNGGYIIDETTGTAYIIVSRNNNDDTATLLSEPPLDTDLTSGRNFWVIPGPNSGLNSPSIRVFQAMLYLP